MKKIILFLFLIYSLFLCVFAQDKGKNQKVEKKSDFSGTWIFDEKASSKKGNLYKSYTLIIFHVEPEIKIKRSAIFENKNYSKDLILYTDERGEKNRPYFSKENPEEESKTFWKKDTLIREIRPRVITSGFSSPRSDLFEYKVTEKYKLSEDKKTLTITLGNNRWVFRRKE